MRSNRSRIGASLLMLAAFLAGGCNEVGRGVAPVELIATATQNVSTIDILNPPGTVGQILVQARAKRTDISDTRFLDVRLTRYRVTYRRTDGGTMVPQPLVRTTSGLVPIGGAATPLNDFVLLEADQLRQAPFAALLPQNGGRDPETGRRDVRMDVIVDVYGETLAGDTVSARVIQPFTFCAACS
jgi:hypothetical protein